MGCGCRLLPSDAGCARLNPPSGERAIVERCRRLYLPGTPLREPVAQPVEQLTFNW